MKTLFSEHRLDWCLRLLLVGAVAAVFWPALQADFVNWDDGPNITENPHLALTWANLKWMFSDYSYVPRYLPVGWLSYAVDRALFGPSALSYHVGNLLLHALSTLLLYAIVKRVLVLWNDSSLSPSNEERAGVRGIHFHGAAAAAALWWAVNPLRTETVAWASSRIYCVAGLFFFLALWLYLRQEQGRMMPQRQSRAVWLAALCFALSLFTYPIALGGLAVFVVLDLLLGRLPPEFTQWWRRQYRSVWAEKLFFLLPALLSSYANWHTVSSASKLLTPAASQYETANQVMQSCWVWAWYVWKPWLPFDLAPRYPDLLENMLLTPAHCCAALLVLAITVLAIFRRRLWPWLLAAWVCHIALLAPFTTQHLHHTYDRYSYIVGGVWAVVIALGLSILLQRQHLRLPVAVAGLFWCSFLGWQAQQQTFFWNNSLNLHAWTSLSIGRHPEAALHEFTVARLLLLLHRPDEALAPIRRAVTLQPDRPSGWAVLGDVLTEQKRFDQAIASYRRALEIKPELNDARQQLGAALALAGRHEEAVVEFTKVVRCESSNPKAHELLAVSLNQLGQTNQAQQHLQEARRLQNRQTKAPAAPSHPGVGEHREPH